MAIKVQPIQSPFHAVQIQWHLPGFEYLQEKADQYYQS
jgi:hypothetical protein